MDIIADLHTHSSFCDHAFSTIDENAREAAKRGLRFLGVTEHTRSIPGAPSVNYFRSLLHNFPDELFGVKIIKGAEVNIIDEKGRLDMGASTLGMLHWVIASMHDICFKPVDIEAHTEAWLAVARNPLVHVIGHCDNPKYLFDHERVIPEFAAQGKIVEINNHSAGARPGSEVECQKIIKLLKKHKVRTIVSSDAHHCSQVGVFDRVLCMLRENDFPQELILNADYERFLKTINDITGLDWSQKSEFEVSGKSDYSQNP